MIEYKLAYRIPDLEDMMVHTTNPGTQKAHH
jgi:hypothetical protein